MAADARGIATLRTEPSDLAFLGVTEIAARYANRSLSPTELVDHLLSRIAALDSCVHAFIRLDADRARGAAVAATAEIAAGRSRGSLHGIPVAIKDVIDVADTPTTCHSRILLDNVARADAAVVAGLREAGAIIIGKVATHEFATGGPIFDLPFPPARNPWNLDCHPGGSSSGSGAGLAAGFFPLSLGTDTAGSARNPAGACGVVGLKPTYGLVSRRGVFPLAHTLDHVGALARSVGDAALLLDAIAGHDPADPASVPASLATADLATADLSRGLRGLRVGYVRHFHETDIPADPEVAAALDNVARVLAAEGAAVTEAILPPLARFTAVNRVIMHAEAFAIHARWLRERPGDYGRMTRENLLVGAFLSAEDYVRALKGRRHLIAAVESVFREVDVLLTAATMEPPTRIHDSEATARSYPRQARTPFNVTGHPALAMMSGLSAAGLPLSVQFVARYFEERTLMRAAAGYERAMDFPIFAPLERLAAAKAAESAWEQATAVGTVPISRLNMVVNAAGLE
jgi:aspartyl-tRNA(Asn)/glutamyl-tRNA(Gln) amidotransferase subunit A